MKTTEWVFYYKTKEGQVIVGTGKYVKPDRTKLYRETQKFLGQKNVVSVGYIRSDLF